MRSISHLSLAIGHALRCDDDVLRDRAHEIIASALDAARGNRTHAARALGVPLRTLQRWLQTAAKCS